MSYFKLKPNSNKTSSTADEVFSIFLSINSSSDEMNIYDDIIRAIKKYYNTQEFNEDHVDLMDELAQRVFKEPVVPIMSNANNNKEVPTDRPNKFKQKYKI